MNQEWQKFIQLEQVGVGDKWDVHDERELHSLGVVQMGQLYLKEVRGKVDKGHEFALVGNHECVVVNLSEYIVRESQVMLLVQFDDVAW